MKEKTVFMGYITKWLFSEGVIRTRLGLSGHNIDCVCLVDINRFLFLFGEGKDWHRTKESALERARVLREKKVKSLKKQLEKVQNMSFDIKQKDSPF